MNGTDVINWYEPWEIGNELDDLDLSGHYALDELTRTYKGIVKGEL